MAAPSRSSAGMVVGETVAGSHVLTIDGYAKTMEAVGVGGSVESGRFSVGGHSWYIECFPCSEDVSVFLCLDHHGAEVEAVTARYKFVLLDRAGEAFLSARSRQLQTFTNTFSSTDDSWGVDEIIRSRQLQSSLLTDNDYFRVRCDVAIVRAEAPQAQPRLGLGDSSPASRRAGT